MFLPHYNVDEFVLTLRVCPDNSFFNLNALTQSPGEQRPQHPLLSLVKRIINRCAWRVQRRLLACVCTGVGEQRAASDGEPFTVSTWGRVTASIKLRFGKKSVTRTRPRLVYGRVARISHKWRTPFEDGPVCAFSKTHVVQSIFSFYLAATSRTKRLLRCTYPGGGADKTNTGRIRTLTKTVHVNEAPLKAHRIKCEV